MLLMNSNLPVKHWQIFNFITKCCMRFSEYAKMDQFSLFVISWQRNSASSLWQLLYQMTMRTRRVIIQDKGPFTLNVSDYFRAAASSHTSYLINWGCKPFLERLASLRILSNVIRAMLLATSQHWCLRLVKTSNYIRILCESSHKRHQR